MSRPIRRGRLDVLDRVRPGLADALRTRVAPVLHPAERGRDAALATASASMAAEPRTTAGAAAALETALALRERWPGPAADRLLVAGSGLVRAAGETVADQALAGLPTDEALRLVARLKDTSC